MHKQFVEDASNEVLRYTEREVAERLKMSMSFLQKSRTNTRDDIARGRAPDFVEVDGFIWYELDDLRSFLANARFGRRQPHQVDIVDLVLLTEEEAAQMLDKSLSWLQKSRRKQDNLIKLGKAPAFYKIGGAIRYALYDIQAYKAVKVGEDGKMLVQPRQAINVSTDAANDTLSNGVWSAWLAPELMAMSCA